MKNNSGLCKSKKCAIGQDPLSSIDERALSSIDEQFDLFEREIDTGVYTQNSIPVLTNEFRDTAVTRFENPIQRQIRLYGEEPFYTAVAAVNAYLERVDLENFPRVRERVEASPLSPIEISTFIDEYQYIPRTLAVQSSILSPKLASELENFYTDNISSGVAGGFCALMPNIFAAIDTFFTALSNIQGFISQVQDFANNFQVNLRNLLNTIRDRVLETVTRVVENIRNIVENFTLENIISEVRTFVESRIVSRFYEMRERILGFFDEFNIENIKNRIRGIINYVSRVFQNPTLEDIQYLIYRLCNLASFVENTLNDLLNPLRDFRNNVQNSLEILRGRSSFNTARAVGAGAIRLTPEEIESRRGAAPTAPTPSGPPGDRPRPPSTVRPATDEEDARVPRWTPTGGTDTSIIDMRGRPEFEWSGMDQLVRVMLVRVQRRFGRPLELVSGRRSYEQQLGIYRRIASDADYSEEEIAAFIRRERPNPLGNTVALPGNSQHESGLAFDLRWAGINRESIIRFWGIAIEEGFTNFGDYQGSNFVHIDARGGGPSAYRADRLTAEDLRNLGLR
jgi:hypothetical protein